MERGYEFLAERLASTKTAGDGAVPVKMMNRTVMMEHAITTLRTAVPKPSEAHMEAVTYHHNYVAREHHFGDDILVTRKGAVRAARGGGSASTRDRALSYERGSRCRHQADAQLRVSSRTAE
jgi:RNA-splicing ligase RtcB